MARLHDGFLTLGHVRGVAVRIHWSTPLGAALLGGFAYRPGAWALFGALVLLHELAHAAAARAFRLEVYSADLMPFGGQCVFEEARTRAQDAAIAAAGPALHVALCAGTLLALAAAGDALPSRARVLLDTVAMANFGLAALNLLPIPPLDGARAWRLVGIGLGLAWDRVARAGARAGRASERRRRAARVAGGQLRAVSSEDGDDSGPTIH